MKPFRIRVERPSTVAFECQLGDLTMSTRVALEDADALVCDWAPSESLYRFTGPRAWYCCEPQSHPFHRDGPGFVRAWRELAPHETFHHRHDDPRWRVPHATHREPLAVDSRAHRRHAAVAVVSEYGRGDPAKWWPDIALRNRFVTHRSVDLYGDPVRWRAYRGPGQVFRRAPRNFRGGLDGTWGSEGKIACLAGYDAAVCLENIVEPLYFTEKFVDVARAGCVPVYRAHPTVREGVLQGARWIDPADFGDDVEATLAAALGADRRAYAEANAAWLRSPAVAATHVNRVLLRVGLLLRNSVKGKAVPAQASSTGAAWFLSYGDHRYERSRARIEREALAMRAFDRVVVYGPDRLGAPFLDRHGDFLRRSARGGGYWLWKPYVVAQCLTQMSEGDVLVYADAGCELNVAGRERLLTYLAAARADPVIGVAFRLTHLERHSTKADLLHHLGVLDDPRVVDTGQLAGGVFVLRKTERSVAIVARWLEVATAEGHRYLDDSPSRRSNLPGFREHRHDQSIFSVLRKRDPTAWCVLPDETWYADWAAGAQSPILARRLSG